MATKKPVPLMSVEQEQELFRKARSGDADARERLVEQVFRLGAYVSSKYHSYRRRQENVSASSVAIMKALDEFDVDRIPYVRWPTFVYTYCLNAIRQEITVESRRRKQDERFKQRYVAPEATPYPDSELLQILLDGLDSLPEVQRNVISLHNYKGLTFREISDAVGVSHETCRKIHKMAINNLRYYFVERGLCLNDEILREGDSIRG